ncbi:4'-phosphopantetheinyl transferase superfamily [Gloeopeniophorella convolvens]|nr:4'-phosphopantetheinyl transferase superfamily [Gloeopeniophorella convolvens]
MGILGIGADVLHLPRLIRHLSNDRLAKRILSPVELHEYLSIPAQDPERRVRFLAVRWTVKEAVYKAVYPTLKPTWQDFTFKKPLGSNKPNLLYQPRDETFSLLLGRIHASVSHDGEYAFATVIVEEPFEIRETRDSNHER